MDEPNILRRRGLQVGRKDHHLMLFVIEPILECIQQLVVLI